MRSIRSLSFSSTARTTSSGILLALALVLAMSTASSTFAATAGDLDRSFGVAGKTVTAFPDHATAGAVIVQPDGKVVVAGTYAGCVLVRYNVNGTLDNTFGNGGTAVVTGPYFVHALTLQPDGGIVVAGGSYFTDANNVLTFGITAMRFTVNGNLDASFGNSGIARVSLGEYTSTGYAVGVQPDGSIVVAGTHAFAIAVVRFTADGILDPTFGTGGIIRESNLGEEANALAILPDGRILIGGSIKIGVLTPTIDDLDFVMYRYTANGARDASFGAGGKVVSTIGGGPDIIKALAVQPDGKIIAAGSVLSDNSDLAIVRYTESGQLDAGQFGSGGKLLVDFGGSRDQGVGVAVDPNGYIVAAGTSQLLNGGYDTILVRCEPDGDLDPGFGVGGKVRTDLGGETESTAGMALQPSFFLGAPNGYKIITTGYWSGIQQFSTARFHGRSGPIARAVVNDFDGNGLSDAANFRASTGDWIIGRIIFPQAPITKVDVAHWGASGDQLAPGDFDGDGIYDLSVYRGGGWHIRISGNGGSYRAVSFGLPGDIPVPADYDGDGRTDIAVFRPSNGAWYYLRSSDGSFVSAIWGVNGDIPTVGDFDGDDRSDLAVFRNGIWYILQSGNGQLRVEYFGLATDKPVAFDYDLDSISDVAVFRDGFWYWLGSRDQVMHVLAFGGAGDIPVPGRYDRGRRTVGIFRNGFWEFEGNFNVWFSGAGNVPVPTIFAQ